MNHPAELPFADAADAANAANAADAAGGRLAALIDAAAAAAEARVIAWRRDLHHPGSIRSLSTTTGSAG